MCFWYVWQQISQELKTSVTTYSVRGSEARLILVGVSPNADDLDNKTPNDLLINNTSTVAKQQQTGKPESINAILWLWM